jgi:hypothetical protein
MTDDNRTDLIIDPNAAADALAVIESDDPLVDLKDYSDDRLRAVWHSRQDAFLRFPSDGTRRAFAEVDAEKGRRAQLNQARSLPSVMAEIPDDKLEERRARLAHKVAGQPYNAILTLELEQIELELGRRAALASRADAAEHGAALNAADDPPPLPAEMVDLAGDDPVRPVIVRGDMVVNVDGVTRRFASGTRLDAATLDLPIGRLDQLIAQRRLIVEGDPAYATSKGAN